MKKIEALIIDDNEEIAQMLSEFLEMEGYKCASSGDGRVGLDMMLQHKFDVVLLDLAMPKFSGRDIIESLVDSGKIKDQNIIIFTASSVVITFVVDFAFVTTSSLSLLSILLLFLLLLISSTRF